MRLAPRFSLRYLHPSHAELGRIGETLAARYLALRGDRIRARRMPNSQAEVDLLTWRQDRWCCVEVKTGRLGPRYSPGARLGRRQWARLQRAARQISRAGAAPAQVDLLEVCLDRRGHFQEIRHHVDIRNLPNGQGPEKFTR